MSNRYLFFTFLLFISLFTKAQNSLFEHFSVQQGLPSNTVQAIKKDKEGQLWLATSKAICKYNHKNFIIIKNAYGEDVSDGIGFYTINNKLYLYTLSGKIYECNNKQLELLPVSNQGQEEFSNRIINTIAYKENKIYIATVIGGGLYSVINGEVNYLFSKEDNIRNFSFFCLEITNEEYVYGSNNIFPANNKFIFQRINKPPLSINLSVKSGYSKSSFVKLEDHTFLFAKEHELIYFNDSLVLQRIFLEKSITCLFQDNELKIWIGLNSGGIICIPSGKPASQGMVYYLGSKSVSGIDEDSKGNIWVATMEDGLFMLPASPTVSYISPKIFSSVNNPKTEKVEKTFPINHQTESVDIFGKKIIATLQRNNDSITPLVFISGIEINNHDTVLQNIYRLKYFQNNLKINFVSFLNNNPSSLQYKYRLLNLSEWIYTSSQTATFNALPPGEYVFEVYAMNNAGIWNVNPAQVTFIIDEPIWKTKWFLLVIFLFLVFIFVLVIYIYRIRNKKEKEKKNEVQKKIMQSELQALRAQMNPHFMFNTLSSIQNFINSKNSDEAVKYLSKFAKLMRSIMENSKKSRVNLKEELEALELYMQLEQLRLEYKFDYEIILDKNIDPIHDEIPPLLIQPYVENAIWHGITHKEGKGKITIHIVNRNHTLQCTINDNGVGRVASEKINRQKNKHKSYGMSITKERLEILNAMQKSQLSVEMADILNDEKQVIGTSVKIFIPIEN
ncbi:MAG: histidine kinase [Flavobacteriales bacterium]|nr:histidine kinase [Flavobacteriales bacterium]